MKVRIVKCSTSTFWYADQIDSTFQVFEFTNDDFRIKGVGGYLIKKEDCEIIEADEPRPEPFDLERALKGEKVVTKDGRIVEEIVQLKSLKGQDNVICSINGSIALYNEHGHTWVKNVPDLEMAPRAPEYQTVWVNLYDAGCAAYELTKNEAIEYNERTEYSGYIGTFPINFKKP